jgi:hypothetical protein
MGDSFQFSGASFQKKARTRRKRTWWSQLQNPEKWTMDNGQLTMDNCECGRTKMGKPQC